MGLFIRQFGLLCIFLSVESSSYFHGNFMETKAIAAYVENLIFILCEIVSSFFLIYRMTRDPNDSQSGSFLDYCHNN